MSNFSESPNNSRWQWVVMALVAAGAAATVWWYLHRQPQPDTSQSVDLTIEAAPVVEVAPPPSLPAANELPIQQETFSPPISPSEATSNSVLQITEETAITEPDDGAQLTLKNSDGAIKDYFSTALPTNPTPLLTNEHLIRKFVRAINSLDEGKLVSQYRPFVQPTEPFKAKQAGDTWHMEEQNFQRYTPYVSMLEAIGPKGLAQTFKQYQPLLQDALNELGTEKNDVKKVAIGALNALLSTPEIDQPLELIRPSVMYQYQNKQLEALPAAQKMLLRMGPENRRRVKSLCRQLLTELQ